MNYYKIKGSCPKAYALLIKHYSIDESLIGTRYFPEDYLGRNLYDFMDEQGIWIKITPPIGFDEGLNDFEWSIFSLRQEIFCKESYKTRTEAEEKAFEKAFEILENKLPIK